MVKLLSFFTILEEKVIFTFHHTLQRSFANLVRFSYGWSRVAEEKSMSPKELEEFMKRVPQDDVWLREHYPAPRYRLTDALRMHRELAAPEMQDNMAGLVYTELELDMSRKKKVSSLLAMNAGCCGACSLKNFLFQNYSVTISTT